MILEQTLQQPFRELSWQTLLTGIFAYEQLDLLQQPQVLEATQNYLHKVGKLVLSDGNILLLDIQTGDRMQLERNRVTFSNFLKRFLNDPASRCFSSTQAEKLADWQKVRRA